MVDLDGRVAIVTGAGGGLGRSHALLLAQRGAKVGVNDLGVTRSGEGAETAAADAVVAEIVDAGGEAVANHDSVADVDGADAIVQTALDSYGRVDVVINNAGFLRDRSFAKMTAEEIVPVVEVHLLGGMYVTKAAWPHLREQGYGRIVNTTSAAGLFGNFGQANYSAAKMGLVGFTQTIAHEGAKYGIRANVIAPLAASRMTEEIMPAELLAAVDPTYVSPLVAYLASEACEDTGRVFSVGGGYVSRVAIVEGPGVVFDDIPTPEGIADRWAEITDVAGGREYPGGAGEETGAVIERVTTTS
ncbi:SDR family oxidoreductase [Euzebya sp.]|uniref:SDR family oxidoreductase n=1 Tax=Euzebya sp. TaxID=1971409 RepID=UPI003514FB7A